MTQGTGGPAPARARDQDPWIAQIERELEESSRIKLEVKALAREVLELARLMRGTLEAGGMVATCGNGGSAADAQHLAAELVGRFREDRRPLASIALTTNPSVVTAISNDWSFDDVFARQVEALLKSGDLLILLSAGGNSPNVVRAAEAARRLGVRTAALIGKGGGRLRQIVDLAIVAPSDETPRIQEAHITIGHIACGLVEQWVLAGGEGS